MRNITKVLPLLALLACVLFAAEARADTFIINSGSATSGTFNGGRFTINGDAFTLNGGFNYGARTCSPCTAGQMASIGSFNLGLDVQGGSATFNGVTYQSLYISQGSVSFGGSFVVPFETAAFFTLTTPFSFSATLNGCTTPNGFNHCPDSNVVFNNATFVGQGIATVEMSSFVDGDRLLYSIRNIRYDFAPAAVPEPATIALLSAGLAGVAAARRRRSKADRGKTS